MEYVYKGLVLLCALLHVGFMYMEMVLWSKPAGMKIFRMSAEMAAQTKTLAFNQGLYNGFLAAGLLWGFFSGEYEIHLFFLVCIIIAGIVGALTAAPNIFFFQALPAILALLSLCYLMYA